MRKARIEVYLVLGGPWWSWRFVGPSGKALAYRKGLYSTKYSALRAARRAQALMREAEIVVEGENP